MASPSPVRVKVDQQGRLVLPRAWRDEIVTVPGEVLLHRTPDGLMLTAADQPGTVTTGADGLPVLSVGRSVTNDEVLAALDHARAER